MREKGYTSFSSKLLSRTAGEGGPSPKGLVGEGSAFREVGAACHDLGREAFGIPTHTLSAQQFLEIRAP